MENAPPAPAGPPPRPRRGGRRSHPLRLAARVAYDGAGFRGFQRQPDARTVEGEIVAALRACGLPEALAFASRTDAGVHARGQVVVWRAPADADPAEVVGRLAARLPPDLRLVEAARAPSRFHPRWSALGKRYEYRLAAGEAGRPDAWVLPEARQTGVQGLRRALEEPLRALRAAPSLQGFTGAGARPGEAPPLQRLEAAPAGDDLVLAFEGPAFRRYAVRNLVGCAVAEALGWLPAGTCAQTAGEPPPYRRVRAPAAGLCLERVFYPPALDPFAAGAPRLSGTP